MIQLHRRLTPAELHLLQPSENPLDLCQRPQRGEARTDGEIERRLRRSGDERNAALFDVSRPKNLVQFTLEAVADIAGIVTQLAKFIAHRRSIAEGGAR